MTYTRVALILAGLVFLFGIYLVASVLLVRCHSTPESTQEAGSTLIVKEHPPDVVLDAEPDVPDKPVWGPVINLNYVEGLWGSKDAEEGWAEFTSKATAKEKGERWKYPYPWHLLLHPPEAPHTYDCGFHSKLMDDGYRLGWRVAWCEGGDLEKGRRHAKRLLLHKREEAVEFVLIDINGIPTVELDRN